MPTPRRKPRIDRALANAAADGRALQLNLPGTCRSDKAALPPRRTEKVLQAQARQLLGNLGYGSLEAGSARKKVKCPCGCGHEFYPEGWQGNTIGYPDLAFFRYAPVFPPIGIFVELKGDNTPVRPEQQNLADQGRSQIARSLDQTVRAVLAAEALLDAYRFTPGRRELFEQYFRINARNPS